MADALVKNDDLSALYCPVGGTGTMQGIASYLGKTVADKGPEVAVIRCAGNCDKRPRTNIFNGASSRSCSRKLPQHAGETSCTFGCLGQGDCVTVCSFGALSMNPISGLPEVDEDKCTACGACVKACPKSIIELRKKGVKGRRIYVACSSKEKGALARKACSAACIGCGKCVKTCPFDDFARTILAYIDAEL